MIEMARDEIAVLRLLVEANRRLRQGVEETVRPVLALITELLGVDTAYFTHFDWLRGTQRVVYVTPGASLPLTEGAEFPLPATLCERAVASGGDLCCVPDLSATWPDKEAAIALGIRSYMSAPIADHEERIFGTLCVASERSRVFTDQEQLWLRLLAQVVSAAVERERLLTALESEREALAARAYYDRLTGAMSRTSLEEAFPSVLASAQARGQALFVAFVDLDGFKAVNDRYGHEVGDQLLVAVTERLRRVLRDEDRLGRWGGDEFVAFGEVERTFRPEEVAQRLAKATVGHYQLRERSLDYEGASVGVALSSELAQPELAELVRLADERMYRAKTARKRRGSAT
ncbi:MAG: sensor domain-containing diguanylate cyclase [Hydrogenophilus sp.]|nr:sensor domain-containing diguanylate cyclase [Hydrogenophilus sp.]